MIRIILTYLFLIVITSNISYSQGILWWFDTNDSSFGQSSAGDIDTDSIYELVFGCYRNDSCVYALNAEDGSLLWKYNTSRKNTEGCNDVASLIYDVDGDNSYEVIVPSSCNPTTFCFNGFDGSIKWASPTRGSDSPPTIGDIDGDGELEILHGEFLGYVICLDAKTGMQKWEILVQENTWIQTAPTLVDLDGDGILDFVVATWCLNKEDTNKIYAFRGLDHKLLWKQDLAGVVYHGTSVADLNNDNKPDLLIADYGAKLYCLNASDGEKQWVYDNPSLYYIPSPISIGDLNGDGNYELVFTSAFFVTTINSNGKEIWNFKVPKGNPSFRGVALADMDGDNNLDIIFGTSTGQVYVLNGISGQVILTYDLAEHIGKSFEIENAPLIADFNKDEILDIFIVGGFSNYPDFSKNYGRAYLLSALPGKGPNWLFFQQNVQRTSKVDKNSTSIKEIANDTFINTNLANNNLSIDLNILKNRKNIICPSEIKIYNIFGDCIWLKKVLTYLDQITIDLDQFTTGIYFLSIENYIFKFVIVK